MQFLISHFIHFALYCNVSRSDSGEEEIGIKSRRICAAVGYIYVLFQMKGKIIQ